MRKRRGLSLLEVVVSAFLFGAVAIVLLNLYPTALLGMHRNQARTRAVELARSALTAVRNYAFDDYPVGTDKVLSTSALEGVKYTTKVKVSAPPEGSADRLRVVKITVSWDQRSVTREGWLVRVRK